MKRSAGPRQLLGFGVTSLAGTLLHFLYDWVGGSPLVAPFSGVNESTFEHMKLLFWPMLLYAVAERFFLRDRKDFWCVKLRGILLGLLLIPLIFYTYNGVIGPSPDWVNIGIFFVSAAVAYLYETKKFMTDSVACSHPRRALLLLGILAFFFVIFTFFPPELGLFRDPLTGGYGI